MMILFQRRQGSWMSLLNKWKLVKCANADTKLNSSARRIIVFLLDRENSRTKKLFPSHLTLANDSNLSVRQVIRALKSLIDNGYLKIILKGSPGRSTSYKVIHKIHTTHTKPKSNT